MKVFNSRDLDWRSARRNLARAFYHSSDFDSKALEVEAYGGVFSRTHNMVPGSL